MIEYHHWRSKRIKIVVKARFKLFIRKGGVYLDVRQLLV